MNLLYILSVSLISFIKKSIRKSYVSFFLPVMSVVIFLIENVLGIDVE